ncbi:MAG: hypothetical protein QOG72_2447 [Sphingomonadales bacterium]|nr:hypothetical protein [Sphingomonadales bacterium]
MSERQHLAAVREVLDNAYEPPADAFADFPPHDGDGYGGAERETPGDGRISMPPGCPVEPLGTADNIFFFLTALGELRALAADKVANKHIVGMFVPYDKYLEETWPRMTQDAKTGAWTAVPNSWKADDTSKHLMRVAAARGVMDVRQMVRGRGAWRDEDGRLILHCGNHVLYLGMWRKPGRYDGFVYPTAPALGRPAPEPAGTGAAVELLAWLKTWNWARPTIDPMLALGWIAIARLGGAIDWRPLIWITGGAQTGKSTLMDLIKALFDGGLLKLGSATEAAVRQLLGQDTLPVLLDEAENEEDDRKMVAIIQLARIAASGDDIGKGGQDHKGVRFTARSCFVFSSILVPGLQPQDKSRFALLELGPLPAGQRAPKISAAEKRTMAAALTRRMVDQWGRWDRTLEAFRDALIDFGGHRNRGADVFGTLLAAAHLAIEDDAPHHEELAMWGHMLAADRLAEMRDADGDDRRCLNLLATSLVQLSGHGQSRSVADWVDQAVRQTSDGDDQARARRELAKIGLGFFVGGIRKRSAEDESDRPQPVPGRCYLVVANANQGLGKLFAETQWKGRPGASGGWVQSLKRIPGAIANERQRIGGITTACTLVPVEAVWGDPSPDEVAVVAAEVTTDA